MTRAEFLKKYGWEIRTDRVHPIRIRYQVDGGDDVESAATMAEAILWNELVTAPACDHAFEELPSCARSGGYFKALGAFRHDQTIAYTMIFCKKCGATREVVAKDFRGEQKS